MNSSTLPSSLRGQLALAIPENLRNALLQHRPFDDPEVTSFFQLDPKLQAEIAEHLPRSEITRLCTASKRFSNTFCHNDDYQVWVKLFSRDISRLRPPVMSNDSRLTYQQIVIELEEVTTVTGLKGAIH